MVEKFAPPVFEQKRFNCPRCGAYAAHGWRPLLFLEENRGYSAISDHGDPEAFYAEYFQDQHYAGWPWVASFCVGCEDHSLWINGQLAFPVASQMDMGDVPEPNPDMPKGVIDLYREAAAVLPHSKRAAAALCRAALEELAKHLTPDLDPKMKLDGRLVNLSGRMAQETTLALQVIRHVGNTALHGQKDGDESVVIYLDGSDNEIASMFFIAINDLATELITRPARIKAAYAKLPQTVREDFERKSGLTPQLGVGGIPPSDA